MTSPIRRAAGKVGREAIRISRPSFNQVVPYAYRTTKFNSRTFSSSRDEYKILNEQFKILNEQFRVLSEQNMRSREKVESSSEKLGTGGEKAGYGGEKAEAGGEKAEAGGEKAKAGGEKAKEYNSLKKIGVGFLTYELIKEAWEIASDGGYALKASYWFFLGHDKFALRSLRTFNEVKDKLEVPINELLTSINNLEDTNKFNPVDKEDFIEIDDQKLDELILYAEHAKRYRELAKKLYDEDYLINNQNSIQTIEKYNGRELQARIELADEMNKKMMEKLHKIVDSTMIKFSSSIEDNKYKLAEFEKIKADADIKLNPNNFRAHIFPQALPQASEYIEVAYASPKNIVAFKTHLEGALEKINTLENQVNKFEEEYKKVSLSVLNKFGNKKCMEFEGKIDAMKKEIEHQKLEIRYLQNLDRVRTNFLEISLEEIQHYYQNIEKQLTTTTHKLSQLEVIQPTPQETPEAEELPIPPQEFGSRNFFTQLENKNTLMSDYNRATELAEQINQKVGLSEQTIDSRDRIMRLWSNPLSKYQTLQTELERFKAYIFADIKDHCDQAIANADKYPSCAQLSSALSEDLSSIQSETLLNDGTTRALEKLFNDLDSLVKEGNQCEEGPGLN